MALDWEASDTPCLLLSQSPPFRSLFTDTYYYYNTPPPLVCHLQELILLHAV